MVSRAIEVFSLGAILLQFLLCSVAFVDGISTSSLNRRALSSSQCRPGRGQEHHGVVNGSGSYWQYQTFKSFSLNPPELQITTRNGSLAPGFLFIAPSDTNTLNPPVTKSPAPMIMTDQGQLVWMGPVSAATVTNLHVTRYSNKPALIYWTGVTYVGQTFGHGWGSIKLLDQSYRPITTFCPKVGLVTHNGTTYDCEADVHESRITSRNNILWVAYNVTRADLTSVGGPKDGWIYDNIIYETDPRSGTHLFRWSAAENVPISATHLSAAGLGTNQSTPLSYFQTNGIVEAGKDAYLLCSRHTSTIFLIDRSTGQIRWRIDGKSGGDFGPLAPEATFNWQHDARPSHITSSSMVLTFLNNDNARFDSQTRPTRAFSLRLDYPKGGKWSAKLLSDVSSKSKPLNSLSQGSHIIATNGNHVLGYGVTPVMREFGPGEFGEVENQDLRWEARFGLDNAVQQYRTWKQEWSAFPKETKPSLIVIEEEDLPCRTAYVSWNGATDVKAWKVYEGANEKALSITGTVPFQGFETRFSVGLQKVVRVVAILQGGEEVASNAWIK